MSYRLQFYEFMIIVASLALFIEAPPMIYGFLTYRQFDYFHLTGYMPYEEMVIALRSGSIRGILNAPLISLNMTSGHLFANMYAFTIGPLVASLILGTLTGFAIIMKLKIQSVGGSTGSGKAAGILGLGLLATIGASSAGLLGCHGGANMSGGILAITGMSATTASLLAWLSPYIQVALIIALACYLFRLHQKLQQA